MPRPSVAFRGRLFVPAVLLFVLSLGAPAMAQYDALEVEVAPLPEGGPLAVMVELIAPPAARVYANVLEKRARGQAAPSVV